MSTKTKNHRVEEIRDHINDLDTQLKTAQHALAAELAEDKKAFTDAMEADLDDWDKFLDRLDAKAAAKSGSARKQAEAAVGDLRRSKNNVATRLAEVREASGDRWTERRKAVTAARVELEKKVDKALQRTFW